MTAAVVGAGAALGGIAASTSRKSNTSTQTQTSTPWEPQGIRLNRNYELADPLLYQNLARGPWQGDLSPDMDPARAEGLAGSVNYARGTGAALAGQAAGSAGALLGAAPGYVNRAEQIANQGAGQANPIAQGVLGAAAMGVPLANPNANVTQGGAGMRAAFGTASDLVAQAGGDPAARALTTAGAYANDPVVREQINAALGDITRNFNENTSPSLNARASGGGNLNSARAGIAEQMARRDAEENAGRVAAQLRGTAFNTGVQASLTGNEQNNALALGANAQRGSLATNASQLGEQARQFDTTARLGAAETLGAQDTANRALDANTRLAANEQTGEAAFRGFDAAQSAGVLFDANTGRLVNAGSAYEQEAARAAAEDYANYMRDYNFRMGLINDNTALVTAGGSWGGTQTGTVTQPTGAGNIFQGILGGAMMGLGASPYFRTAPTVGGVKTAYS